MIRIFVTGDLGAGVTVVLDADRAHYLANVMRLARGEELRVFNGRDGEWRARLVEAGRRGGTLEALRLERGQMIGPDVELVAAIVKRSRLETIVEKAAELGARRVRLVVTERTVPVRANVSRLCAIATEAAEQTGRLETPPVEEPVRLDQLIAEWSFERALMFCDEAGGSPSVLQALEPRRRGPWGVLIGPEGGFSERERALVRACPQCVPVTLGPRILRADTAAVVALGLWQAALGDLAGA